jgi:tetratricopeptide (TPR) repeat protein
MKKLMMFTWILALVGISSGTFARDGKEDKIINKYKEIIENSSPDDWYTLANSADMCLKKNINRKEVAEWLERSLSIKETPYNLEVKGDYYRINNLPEKAGQCYLKAIQLGSENDPNFDTKGLQTKIAEVLNLVI